MFVLFTGRLSTNSTLTFTLHISPTVTRMNTILLYILYILYIYIYYIYNIYILYIYKDKYTLICQTGMETRLNLFIPQPLDDT